MAPRIDQLQVRNLRSVGGAHVNLKFPDQGVLVILGENNAGKSNLTRALDILFGEQWPGSRQLEDHDFHGRDSDGIAVEIGASLSGTNCPYCDSGSILYVRWKCDPNSPGDPVDYTFTCSGCKKTYPNKAFRNSLAAAVLDSDRRLDYQLSYASKYTMLSKLMHRFHERLMSDPHRRDRLSDIFSSLLEQFSEVPEFAAFRDLLAKTADDFGQNLPYRLNVDFSAYDPSNFFRSLRVHPSLEGDARNFDELGTGQSQVLALAFAYAYAQAYGQADGTILVIDEPEANLHPLAQMWLASRLNKLAAPGLQVVLTTHSPHFVDLARPENLALVKKDPSGVTEVIQRSRDELAEVLLQRGADPDRTNSQSVGPFYATAATSETLSGLFARSCVLVEGPTEALALPELLRARGLDVLREGIAVVSVEGIGNIAKWLRFFSALCIPVFAIFDTDSDKPAGRGDARKLLDKRLDIGAALGLAEDPASGQDLPLRVNQTHATVNPNFEGAMRTLFGSEWADLQEEVAESVGHSKPLMARYVAQKLPDNAWGTAACKAIDELTQAILALVAEPKDSGFGGQESDEEDGFVADEEPPF